MALVVAMKLTRGPRLRRCEKINRSVILSEAKDLRSCFFSATCEELQRCFASLSMTDSNFFTPSYAVDYILSPACGADFCPGFFTSRRLRPDCGSATWLSGWWGLVLA